MPSKPQVKYKQQRQRYDTDEEFRQRKLKYQREWRAKFKKDFGVCASKMYGYITDMRATQ